jgi:hypothetical protein
MKKISGDIPPLFAGNINLGGNLPKFTRIAIAPRIKSSEILNKSPTTKKSPDTSQDQEFLTQFSQQ